MNDRQARRETKRNAGNVEADDKLSHFELAPRSGGAHGEEEGMYTSLSEDTIKRRELIKQGLGKNAAKNILQDEQRLNKNNKGKIQFEVVPAEQDGGGGLLPRHDDRDYDSENEEYDAHDRAMTLALGTLMLKRSRKKALVDASYNRFAWNGKFIQVYSHIYIYI